MCLRYAVRSSPLVSDDRKARLEHNKLFRILEEEKLLVLVNKALSGVNKDSRPATLNETETKELCRSWLASLCNSSIAKKCKVDAWVLSPQELQAWASNVVECFPGEVKETWYSPATFRKVSL